MAKIKFSHHYKKLMDLEGEEVGETNAFVSHATLLEVQIVNLDQFHKEFLDYDTDNGQYKLPKKGRYLMLIFLKPDKCNLFTTLRPFTLEKYNYYLKLIGKEFEIEINGG